MTKVSNKVEGGKRQRMEDEREGKGRERKGEETLPLTRKLNVNK